MPVDRLFLNCEFSTAGVIAYKRIPIVIQPIEGRLVDPKLLDELELTPKVGIEHDKKQALLVLGIIFRQATGRRQ